MVDLSIVILVYQRVFPFSGPKVIWNVGDIDIGKLIKYNIVELMILIIYDRDHISISTSRWAIGKTHLLSHLFLLFYPHYDHLVPGTSPLSCPGLQANDLLKVLSEVCEGGTCLLIHLQKWRFQWENHRKTIGKP